MGLLKYQKYRCALSGRKLVPQIAALDHIVPIRLDGEHTIDNVQVLHRDVNRAKGSMTNAEFIRLCREVIHFQACRPLGPVSPQGVESARDKAQGAEENLSQPAQNSAFSNN